MNIRGIVKFSLIDYPGKIACVLFVGGCNYRCGYCHNPHLVFDPESQPLIREPQVLSFLRSRQGKLDGVVITGGEPSLRGRFAEFATKIVELGYMIKLDTNASMPDMIETNHRDNLIHALGIDYKAPFSKYNEVSGCDVSDLAERVQRSLKYAVDNGIQLDVRTTVHRSLLSFEDLKQMRKELDDLGVAEWHLQQFHPVEIIDESLLKEDTYSDLDLVAIAKKLGPNTHARNLKGVVID